MIIWIKQTPGTIRFYRISFKSRNQRPLFMLYCEDYYSDLLGARVIANSMRWRLW